MMNQTKNINDIKDLNALGSVVATYQVQDYQNAGWKTKDLNQWRQEFRTQHGLPDENSRDGVVFGILRAIFKGFSWLFWAALSNFSYSAEEAHDEAEREAKRLQLLDDYGY